MITIRTLLTGQPQTIQDDDMEWESAIFRTPTPDAITLTAMGFMGDQVADEEAHGGRDKAVCAYPAEHYPYWQGAVSPEMTDGAFGENLTLNGLLETEACIGDCYKVGSAVVEISQPRVPCWKPAKRWGTPTLTKQMATTGYTGWYFRMVEGGDIQQGDTLTLIARPNPGMTVDKLNTLYYKDRHNASLARKFAALPQLTASWGESLLQIAERAERG